MTLTPLLPLMYEPLVRTALLEDLGRAGDITADAIVPADRQASLVLRARQPGAELAPRDIVARAVWRRRVEGHRVFLDARKHPGAEFAKRYPVISAFCKMAGIDPATDPIPVRPAVH